MESKYEKHLEKFFNETNPSKTERENYLSLIRKLENEKYIAEWDNDDLEKFILELNSISVNSVSKYLQYIRNIYAFVCREDRAKSRRLYLAKDLQCYINTKKLFKTMLDEQGYRWLKNLLVVETYKGQMNFRDKVLVELAWEGLSADEIRTLKTDDIEFHDGIMKLNLKDRMVEIKDEEVIYDVKKTIEQDEYYIYGSSGRKEQFRKMKQTPYLIKPVVTRIGKKDTVTNPSLLLKNVLSKLEDTIPGIDLDKITLEDIRRSRTISLFKKGHSMSEVKDILGKRAECDLYWLQEIALTIKNK